MSVLFTCANTLKEAMSKIESDSQNEEYSPLGNENYLALPIEDNEFYMFLHDIKSYLDEIDNGCADDFLLKLKIYEDEVLSVDRVKSYLNLSKVLLNDELINYLDNNNMYKNYEFESDTQLTKEYYMDFSIKLKDMCQRALDENQQIFIFGE